MAEDSAHEPKYGRGEHPRSLANLRAPWRAGEAPNPHGVRGPLIGPAMRKYAQMSLDELRFIWDNSPTSLSVAEAIAITTLIDALSTGSFTTGARSREQVFDRIDGAPAKAAVEVEVGVKIKLTWGDA